MERATKVTQPEGPKQGGKHEQDNGEQVFCETLSEEPLQDSRLACDYGDGSEQSEHPQQAQKTQELVGSEKRQFCRNVNEVPAEKSPASTARDEAKEQLQYKQASDKIACVNDVLVHRVCRRHGDLDAEENDGNDDQK